MSPCVVGADRTGMVVRYASAGRVVYLFVPAVPVTVFTAMLCAASGADIRP